MFWTEGNKKQAFHKNGYKFVHQRNICYLVYITTLCFCEFLKKHIFRNGKDAGAVSFYLIYDI